MQQESGISLTKTEYIESSGQEKSGNFKVLPQKEWKPKSFVIGQQKGRVNLYKPLYGYVRGEQLKNSFKRPIQSIEIGGWGKDFRDRIFFTDGDNIIGQTKRNVVMFQKRCDFMNNMVKKLWVDDHYVWLMSSTELCEIFSKSYSFTTERNSHYYSKTCEIKDFCLLQPQPRRYLSLLLTEDKHIRLIDKSECTAEHQLANQAIISQIPNRVPWVAKPNLYQQCLVGLEGGKIVTVTAPDEKTLQTEQFIQPQKPNQLTNFKQYDFKENGLLDLMVGYKDGGLQLYSKNINGQMELDWNGNFSHGAIDIEGGEVSDVSYKEFLISSEDGKLFGLGEKVKRTAKDRKINEKKSKLKTKGSLEGQQNAATGKSSEVQEKKLSESQKLQQLQQLQDEYQTLLKEQEKLKQELEKKKKNQNENDKKKEEEDDNNNEIVLDEDSEEQGKKETEKIKQEQEEQQKKKISSSDIEQSENQNKPKKSKLEAWILKTELLRNEDDGSMEICLVSENALSMMTVSCDLQDIEFCLNDPLQAKLSVNSQNVGNSRGCVYTIIKDDIFEYTIKFYVKEGQQGNFKIFVICQNNQTTAQQVKLYLNPLFMHKMIDTSISEEYTPNSLTISGGISQRDIYFWFNMFLQDFEMSSDDSFNGISFENPFTQTFVLIKTPTENECIIYSSSIITLQNLKKLITDDTNMKGKQVDIRWDVSNKSLKRNLKFYRNKLREHKQYIDKIALLDGLKDISSNAEDAEFISEEFKQLLTQKQEIEEGFKNLPQNLPYLKKLVVELYCSYSQLKGIYGYESKIEQLEKLLDKYKYKQIFELMNCAE